MHAYYMDDCNVSLPDGFVDRSVNVLEWTLDGGDKVALCIQREALPAEGGLEPFVVAQTKSYPTQFAGYRGERDERAGGDDDGPPMWRRTFRWKHEETVLYHHQVFVLAGGVVLIFTGSAKANRRKEVDELVDGAVAALRVRAPGSGDEP